MLFFLIEYGIIYEVCICNKLYILFLDLDLDLDILLYWLFEFLVFWFLVIEEMLIFYVIFGYFGCEILRFVIELDLLLFFMNANLKYL